MTLKKPSNEEHPIIPLIYNLLGIPLALTRSLINGFTGFSWPMLRVAFASYCAIGCASWLILKRRHQISP
ncbi:MAG: hypothetical protein LPD71_14640 [Shewanella sp.]|nr:hypothetical protein [Shewanella sp.]